LEFIEPFASVATAGFTLEPYGNGVVATWRMDGTNNLMGKAISVFMDMDRLIGTEFEKGLASLKALAESEARKRAAGHARAASPGGRPRPRRFQMKGTRFVAAGSFAVALAWAAPALAPPDMKPTPEHARLGYFVGKWQTEGEMKPGPFGPGGKLTSQDDCQWFEGKFAGICNGQGKG